MKNAPHKSFAVAATAALLASCAAGPQTYERQSVNRLTHYGPEAAPKPTNLPGIPATIIDPNTAPRQAFETAPVPAAPEVFAAPPQTLSSKPVLTVERIGPRETAPAIVATPRIVERPPIPREPESDPASLLVEQPSAPQASLDHTYDDVPASAAKVAASSPPKPAPPKLDQGYDVVVKFESAQALETAEQKLKTADIKDRFSVNSSGRHLIYFGRYRGPESAQTRRDNVAQASGLSPRLQTFGGAAQPPEPAAPKAAPSEPLETTPAQPLPLDSQQESLKSNESLEPLAGDANTSDAVKEKINAPTPDKEEPPAKPSPVTATQAPAAAVLAPLPHAESRQPEPLPSADTGEQDVVIVFGNEAALRAGEEALQAAGITRRFAVVKPERYRIYVGRFGAPVLARERAQDVTRRAGVDAQVESVGGL